MLTLFAIVLVIGTVVDDSVVVVEAVQAKFDCGEADPYKAAVSAMGGLVGGFNNDYCCFYGGIYSGLFHGWNRRNIL